ncbi:hypothetical protein GCM10020331_086600 [Ectobacillus funiculus]
MENMYHPHEEGLQKRPDLQQVTTGQASIPCSMVETVYSPCCGKVEKVFVNEESYIYEWEKLLTIRTEDGGTEEVAIGVSGNIASVEVEPGEEVNTNTVLCKVADDLKITGCE